MTVLIRAIFQWCYKNFVISPIKIDRALNEDDKLGHAALSNLKLRLITILSRSAVYLFILAPLLPAKLILIWKSTVGSQFANRYH